VHLALAGGLSTGGATNRGVACDSPGTASGEAPLTCRAGFA